MNVSSTSSTATLAREAQRRSASNVNASRGKSDAPVESTTTRPTAGSPSDKVSLSVNSMAMSSNLEINSVIANILGPRAAGNSAADSLSASLRQSGGSSAEDPAAKFRSETKVPLEGYDQAKLDNPEHQTPKYLFGRVAQGFNLDSVQGDKAKAEELLKAMLPDLKAAGLEVVAVKGDRIQVKTEVGYEWVDVVRGAGSDKPGWWWGSEGKGTAQPTNTVQDWVAQTGQGGDSHSQAAPMGANSGGGGGAMAPAGGGGAAAAGGPVKATPLGNQIDQGKVMEILKKQQPSNAGMRAAEADLQQQFPGVKILDHPVRLDKLQFTNGAVVDVMVGAGGPNPSWGWMPEN